MQKFQTDASICSADNLDRQTGDRTILFHVQSRGRNSNHAKDALEDRHRMGMQRLIEAEPVDLRGEHSAYVRYLGRFPGQSAD